MAKTIIQELISRFGFEVDEAELRDAEQALDKIESIGKRVAVAITAGAAALSGAIYRAASYGDEVLATSKQVGVGVEALQELQYGARLANVETAALRQSLLFLNKAASGSGIGGKNAGQALAEIGVEARDSMGQLRPTEEILEDVAEQFEKLPDGAQKSSLAMRIFGRAGAQMIPFLNEGKAGIATLRQEARDLGIVMGSRAAVQADRLSDNLGKVKDVADGVVRSIGGRFFDASNRLIERFLEWYKLNQSLIQQRIDLFIFKVENAIRRWWMVIGPIVRFLHRAVIETGLWKVALLGLAFAFGALGSFQVVAALKTLQNISTAIAAVTGVSLKALFVHSLWFGAFVLLLLILDDFLEMMRGGKSVIGEFVEAIDKKPKGLSWWVDTLKTIVEALREMDKLVTKVFFRDLEDPTQRRLQRQGATEKLKSIGIQPGSPLDKFFSVFIGPSEGEFGGDIQRSNQGATFQQMRLGPSVGIQPSLPMTSTANTVTGTVTVKVEADGANAEAAREGGREGAKEAVTRVLRDFGASIGIEVE